MGEFKPLPYDGTFESAKKCHKHLWDYLAKTGEDKPYIPLIEYNCYACQYLENVIDKVLREKIGDDDDAIDEVKYNLKRTTCPFCPIAKVGGKYVHCASFESLYFKWSYSFSDEDKKHYAELLRDIPFEDHSDELEQYIISTIDLLNEV